MLTLRRRVQSRGQTRKRTSVCPQGYLLRKGYTRKFENSVRQRGYTVKRGDAVYRVYPTAGSVYVKPTCVKDRGLPGTIIGPGIGPLKKGELIKYGYSFRLPSKLRHEALKKAISEYSALSVYRKLDAVAKLSLRTNPKASKRFSTDRDWVRENYGANGLKQGI